MQPWLTVDQKRRRLDFVKTHKKDHSGLCGHVLFGGELPFELFQVPNGQKDRVRPNSSSEVPIPDGEAAAEDFCWGRDGIKKVSLSFTKCRENKL